MLAGSIKKGGPAMEKQGKHAKQKRRRVVLQPFESSLPATFPTGQTKGPPLTRTCTLKQWLEHWLNDVVAVNREPTTLYSYQNIVNNHLIPALGRVRLCDLTPKLIQSYYTWVKRNKHLSTNSVRKHHILLHTALQLAYRQGILPNNPLDRVDPPKVLPAHQTFYNPEQLARLLDLVEGQPLELPVKLAGYLGLRRSEIAGLRWCDVDLARGQVSIRQVRTAAGNQVITKAPKTVGSLRTLDISCLNDLLNLLDRQKVAHRKMMADMGLPWRDDLNVVITNDGKPWHPNQLTLGFRNFVNQRKIPKVTLHGLRHTFASVANDARVPMAQISKTLGHSDPTITARIYTHVFDQTHGEVLSAVAAAIPGRSVPLREKPEKNYQNVPR
jgi:integrase